MILNETNLNEQLNSLFKKYNRLEVVKKYNDKVIIEGEISINRFINQFRLNKVYNIRIEIPLNSDVLPHVFDLNNKIEKQYPHRYKDGGLCLETDTFIRKHFISGFNIVDWMTDFVETYFATYEFYKRFGEYPFGEREHGEQGIFGTYCQFFNEYDMTKVKKLMKYITYNNYRGHKLCPCGSKIKLRECHGESIKEFCTNPELKRILIEDYKSLIEKRNSYAKQYINQTK